jgi:Rieske 2Fe-2S family protein
MTAIFDHPWLCLGRIEDLPSPGSWLRAPLTRAGVLVTRGHDGELRAFHAVCTHRGSALFDAAAPEEGHAARFTCPYHNFEFELDGRACAQVSDLAPVRIDTALGFVFVTLDDDAPPLAEAIGEAPPWLARADLANAKLRRARRVAYDVAARWTIVVEDIQESLHFASVPEVDRRVVYDALRFPNLLTSVQPDCLLTFVLFPMGEGHTRVVASTYVDEDAPEPALDDVLDRIRREMRRR